MSLCVPAHVLYLLEEYGVSNPTGIGEAVAS